MPHVVLLGDSILDNGAYVGSGSPVVEQLRSRLPGGWRVTLLARDGDVALGVLEQLKKLPADASHLVVSAGGNDALQCSPLIHSALPDPVAMLEELVSVQQEFRENYREMIRAVRATKLPAVACTIYDAVPGLSPVERMALSLFNDVMLREIIAANMPALDLRFVCHEPRDYAAISPIEPSEIGGLKIARQLHNILLDHDFAQSTTRVYS
ncbi:MAG: SGNH/GDSL hydrolase family protein [Planctomycetota bacterium]